jgi:hypothetical protein
MRRDSNSTSLKSTSAARSKRTKLKVKERELRDFVMLSQTILRNADAAYGLDGYIGEPSHYVIR